jgi:hypothetical protein
VSASDERLERAASLIADRLNAIRFEWRAQGHTVVGPGTTAILAAERHVEHPNHIDIGFVFNRNDPDSKTIWDCSTGWVADADLALVDAIDKWAGASAPVWLELMTLKGDFAEHYEGSDEGGFPGWHAIHGPFIGWGRSPGLEDLLRWTTEHHLLSALHDSVARSLKATGPVALRLYLGAHKTEATAEVQIDGVVAQGPSAVLASLPWPRPDFAFARAFVLLVHPEEDPSL